MSWVLYAVVLFVAAFIPLVAGPDTAHPKAASESLTMTFVVMGLGTVFNALTNRRDPASGLDAPIFKAAVVSLFPVSCWSWPPSCRSCRAACSPSH